MALPHHVTLSAVTPFDVEEERLGDMGTMHRSPEKFPATHSTCKGECAAGTGGPVPVRASDPGRSAGLARDGGKAVTAHTASERTHRFRIGGRLGAMPRGGASGAHAKWGPASLPTPTIRLSVPRLHPARSIASQAIAGADLDPSFRDRAGPPGGGLVGPLAGAGRTGIALHHPAWRVPKHQPSRAVDCNSCRSGFAAVRGDCPVPWIGTSSVR